MLPGARGRQGDRPSWCNWQLAGDCGGDTFLVKMLIRQCIFLSAPAMAFALAPDDRSFDNIAEENDAHE
jgi:hypothetical protein